MSYVHFPFKENCAFYVFLFQMYAANITNKIKDDEFQPQTLLKVTFYIQLLTVKLAFQYLGNNEDEVNLLNTFSVQSTKT